MKYALLSILTIFLVMSCNPQKVANKKETTKNVKKTSKKDVKKETLKKVDSKEKKKESKSVIAKKVAYKPVHAIITDETIMAKFNGKNILFKDIKKNYKSELNEANNELLKEQYQKTSLQVNKFVIEKLLNEEAKKQGLRNHKVLLDKITSATPKPTKKEIDAMTKKYAKQFAQRKMKPKEITKLVTDYIMNQKKNDVAFKYLEKIKKDKGFKITLPYPDIPSLKIEVSDKDAFEGPKNAKYTLVEFSDFQCPYCSRIAPVISKLTKDNKDVKVVFKYFPLSFHKMAKKAAKSAICANEQGKFWEFHNKVFANQKDLNDVNLEKWVKELKIDMNKYKTCLASPNTEKLIEKDLMIGSKIGVKGTPSLYLNGIQINSTSKDAINRAINAERNKVVGELKNDTVIAKIGKKNITWNDFLNENKNFSILSKTDKMKSQYELYAKLLSKELSKQILEMAAKDAGDKDINAYIKKLMLNVKDPSEKELKALYKQLKPKLQGKSYEQVKKQLIQYSKQMNGQKVIQSKMKELSNKYNVQVTMPLPLLPKLNINIKDAPFMGNKDAKYTLVEFSDFQCPYCSRAAKFTDKILKKYPKKVKIVFKHFPLPFHKKAHGAAIAAQCFYKQGKFAEFYSKAFSNQDKLGDDAYIKWAKEFKLNENNFKKCLKDINIANEIDKNLQEGQELGIQGTPTLYLDGVLYNEAHDLATFSKYIK